MKKKTTAKVNATKAVAKTPEVKPVEVKPVEVKAEEKATAKVEEVKSVATAAVAEKKETKATKTTKSTKTTAKKAVKEELKAEVFIQYQGQEAVVADAIEKAKAELVKNDEPVDPPVELPYKDVAETDWFYDAVYYTYTEGLMTGLDGEHFGPYGQLSRAQFALILYRMEGTPEFTTSKSFHDITGSEWYGQAVLWAAENGIVTGYQGGYFGPADMITREQMAVMMYRYAKYLEKDVETDSDYSAYTDAALVSGFAEEAMKWATGNGIITGKSGGTVLDPQGNTARSEAAVIIQRFRQ